MDKGASAKFILLSYRPLGTLDRINFSGGGVPEGPPPPFPQKMLETRFLDRINFFSLQTKGFGRFLGFILSKTRVLDRINFFSLWTKVFQQSLSYYPIGPQGLLIG